MGSSVLSAWAVRWALVLSVLCGMLAMHALVLGPSTHPAAAFASHDTTTVAYAGHRAPSPPVTAAAAHGTAAHGTAADGTVSGIADPAGVGSSTPVPGGHSPAGHDHGFLHLCLAVLTLLAGLLVAPLLARLVRPAGPAPTDGPVHGRRTATSPAGPPPPSAVRLAELCVLRT